MAELREDQIKRMVSESTISPEEGQRLLDALAKSRSGEAGIEMARQVGKRTRKRRWPLVLLIVVAVAVVATGITLGLYFILESPRSASELMEEGQAAFAAGDYDRAIELYTGATDKEPGSSAAYNLLGMAYRFKYNETADRKYKQEEIDAFEKAIELDPSNFVPYVNLGATLYYQGQLQEAAGYLEKALELYPNNPERAAIEDMIRQSEQAD
ncbi:MAG: tetratricopeptide repeat protein [Actinobacteria bacterium]|nr:tetratricopeptide repeat protein [Actinomycetota bacterium]MBU1944253.1 tetratricopeptide repeat protein [Actinomycetota bacterium]MBU2688006.1 tetratricopeptide repeat protein [Actinomycetota bacterium]